MKITHKLAIIFILLHSSTQAASVFIDTFDHAGDLVVNGGWTRHNGGDLNGNGSGRLIGNGANPGNWAEYDYTVALSAGDILTIDANVDRLNQAAGYGYITEIYLTNGVTPMLMAGGTQQPNGVNGSSQPLNQVSYTVTAGDITAGRDHVTFRYGHGTIGWGETHDVDFGVTAVPEPSSTALLGLAGFALLLRRR